MRLFRDTFNSSLIPWLEKNWLYALCIRSSALDQGIHAFTKVNNQTGYGIQQKSLIYGFFPNYLPVTPLHFETGWSES